MWSGDSTTTPDELREAVADCGIDVLCITDHNAIRGAEALAAEALAGELVGLAELETGGHIVRFCSRDLGVIDRDRRFRRFAPPRARLMLFVAASNR